MKKFKISHMPMYAPAPNNLGRNTPGIIRAIWIKIKASLSRGCGVQLISPLPLQKCDYEVSRLPGGQARRKGAVSTRNWAARARTPANRRFCLSKMQGSGILPSTHLAGRGRGRHQREGGGAEVAAATAVCGICAASGLGRARGGQGETEKSSAPKPSDWRDY